MANSKECIAAIIKASKDVLNEREAGELLRKFRSTIDSLPASERVASLASMLDDFRDNSVRRNQVYDIWEKQKNLLDLQVKDIAKQRLDNAFKDVGKRGKGATNYVDAFNTLLFGRPGERGGLTVAYEGTRQRFNIALQGPLEEQGLLGHWKDPDTLNRAIEFAWDTGAKDMTPESQSIGGTLRNVMNLAIHRLNQGGAYVLNTPRILFNERVAASDKIRKVGLQGFLEFVDTLNLDKKVFEGMDAGAIKEHFEKVYHNLAGGWQYQAATGSFDAIAGLTKEKYADLAAKNSLDVGIPFADAKSFKLFAEKFADEPLYSLLTRRVDQIGRSVGIMENFGSSPDKLVRELLAENAPKMSENDRSVLLNKGIDTRGPIEGVDSFFNYAHPEDVVSKMLGITDAPASETAARLGSGGRALASLMSMSGGVFSQSMDIATRLAMLETYGRGPFQTILSPITALANLFPDAERKTFYGHLGIYADILRHNMAHQFDPGASGRVSQVIDMGFKLGGMPTVDRIMKQSSADIMSSNLAWALQHEPRHAVINYFKSYGMNDADMVVLKQAIGKISGMEVVDPRAVQRLDGKVYERYLSAMNGFINTSTPTPGLLETTANSKGLKAGTPMGEAVRTIMQFKSYPAMLMKRVYPEIYYERGTAGVLSTIVWMVALGYLGDSAKQLAQGKTPRDMSKPENIANILIHSGAGGIYGDLLTTNPANGGLASALAGPLVSHAGDIAGLGMDAVMKGNSVLQGKQTSDEAFGKYGVKVAKTLDKSLPVPFYLKDILERTLIYGMMEGSDPGSVDRMYEDLNRRTGQERIF